MLVPVSQKAKSNSKPLSSPETSSTNVKSVSLHIKSKNHNAHALYVNKTLSENHYTDAQYFNQTLSLTVETLDLTVKTLNLNVEFHCFSSYKTLTLTSQN
eukprot:c22999_g1_i4 orf=123-422(+)